MPSVMPTYRQNRPHADFVANLGMLAEAVKRGLRRAWEADQPLLTVPSETISLLARDKYETREWNRRI